MLQFCRGDLVFKGQCSFFSLLSFLCIFFDLLFSVLSDLFFVQDLSFIASVSDFEDDFLSFVVFFVEFYKPATARFSCQDLQLAVIFKRHLRDLVGANLDVVLFSIVDYPDLEDVSTFWHRWIQNDWKSRWVWEAFCERIVYVFELILIFLLQMQKVLRMIDTKELRLERFAQCHNQFAIICLILCYRDSHIYRVLTIEPAFCLLPIIVCWIVLFTFSLCCTFRYCDLEVTNVFSLERVRPYR